jgi:hypothetical protein
MMIMMMIMLLPMMVMSMAVVVFTIPSFRVFVPPL